MFVAEADPAAVNEAVVALALLPGEVPGEADLAVVGRDAVPVRWCAEGSPPAFSLRTLAA